VIESAVGRTLRSYGSLPHPNILAGFLVIAIILCFVLCITHEQKNRRNMYALLVLLLLSSGLWTTFSRQAWIALAIVLCGILLHTFFVKRIFSPVAIIATLSVVIPMSVLSLLYPHLLESRIHMNTRLEQWSVTEREHYMHQSVDIVRNHWATGVGMGNYTAFIHSQDKQHNIIKPGTTYQPVHNIYLLIFSELGIFGLSALVLLLLSVGIHIQKQNPYSMAWGMSIIALLIIGFFDHYLWSLHIGLLLFWITLGFSESRS
ncbi:MAG TPA: O-antigen ligase family protein, partial [Patescibacteria group bacterium]|nr:O-antigen ligase family protein [Patescibacteria group bacterium]